MWAMWRFLLLIGLATSLLALRPEMALGRSVEPAQLPTPPLRNGDRGEPVAALQRQLRAAGFDPGPVDGIFGPLTEAAVRQAQSQLQVTVDGVAGRQTMGALQSRVGRVGRAGASSLAPLALTFNGNPDPEVTPTVLRLLQEHGVTATFFILGETAERTPELLASIAADGHEIANNGFAEIDMTRISTQMRTAQLRRAQLALTEAAGRPPAFFRPPGGRYDGELVRAASDMGLSLMLWTNVSIRDLPELDPLALADGLEATLYPGAVLMLHQDRPRVVETLEELLPRLEQAGYRSVAISALGDDLSTISAN